VQKELKFSELKQFYKDVPRMYRAALYTLHFIYCVFSPQRKAKTEDIFHIADV